MSFSAEEIYEIALQIERNGIDFYAHAARVAPDESLRTLLMDLVAMEEDHVTTFTDMRSAASGEMATGDEEMLSYIRAMADGHIFDVGIDPKQILTGEETAEEILSIAIGLEKESVVYYAALQEVVSDETTRRQVHEILLEEMGHIALLSGKREALA